MRPILAVLFSLTLAIPAIAGADLLFDSTTHRVSLLELYTSEGCSSCPPAEAWFSTLKNHPALWKNFVPVSFHVDYWDSLGWPDRFASKEFTTRQRLYAASWNSDTVYTPAFVLNGAEWKIDDIPAPAATSGRLTATLSPTRQLTIRYTPTDIPNRLEAHIALLGFNLLSNVRAGENRNRTLTHDFITLTLLTRPLRPSADTTLQLPTPAPGEKAVAIWITDGDAPTPLQATGGWLK